MCFLAGQDSFALRVQAEAALAARADDADCVLVWDSGGRLLGVWTALLSEDSRPRLPWVQQTLAPFFVIALRQTRWQDEITVAQSQVEKRIREVATVYEIGQAMDSVEIDRLLDMITEKAAAVMEAQACSLLLRLAETRLLRAGLRERGGGDRDGGAGRQQGEAKTGHG